MQTNTTRFEVSDKVAWITLNRPEAMNALNPELRWQLSEHLNEIEQNDDIWLAVITGAGEKAFCAGADLKHRALERQANEQQRLKWRQLAEQTTHIAERWHFCKPLIAMVNGFALGGGLEIALACDIIVSADHAEFGLPEPRRGLIAGAAGVLRLARHFGLKPAMGFLLTGRHMTATRAYELGLVNEVVNASELKATVDGYVSDILRCAPLAIRATKACAMQGLDLPLAQAFHHKYAEETLRQKSHDALEGPLAFAEKRQPQWQGN